jgi:hypothetical protein
MKFPCQFSCDRGRLQGKIKAFGLRLETIITKVIVEILKLLTTFLLHQESIAEHN